MKGPFTVENAHIEAIFATFSISQEFAAMKILTPHIQRHAMGHIGGSADGRVGEAAGLRLSWVWGSRHRVGLLLGRRCGSGGLAREVGRMPHIHAGCRRGG